MAEIDWTGLVHTFVTSPVLFGVASIFFRLSESNPSTTWDAFVVGTSMTLTVAFAFFGGLVFLGGIGLVLDS